MIKNVYCFKNIKSSNFDNPVLEVLDKEQAIEAYSIWAKESNAETQAHVKELDLYYLGTFDTKTGTFEAIVPELLLCMKEVFVNGEN